MICDKCGYEVYILVSGPPCSRFTKQRVCIDCEADLKARKRGRRKKLVQPVSPEGIAQMVRAAQKP